MKKIVIAFSISLFFGINSFAQQNVSINTTGAAPDASSILDISSTSKGLLIPRMTQSQRNAIATPATALTIYQTDNNPGYYYYDGTQWLPLTGTDDQNLTGASLSGNILTIDIENGTSTSVDLSSLAGSGGTDDQNIQGSGLSGTNLTIGIENGTSEIVDLAPLQDGTGTDDQNLTSASLTGTTLQIDIENGTSTSVDLAALQDGTGTDDQNIQGCGLTGNILTIGIENGTSETVDLSALLSGGGNDWTLLGNAGTIDGTNFIGTTDNIPLSFRVNNTHSGRIADDNTSYGYNAGRALTSGTNNVLIGEGSGYNLTTADDNVAIGHNALYGYMSSNVGNNNVAIGWDAMFYTTDKSSNVAIGKSALSLPPGGIIEETVAIGYYSDKAGTTPNHSVAIGARTEIGAENTTAIGFRASATQANSMVLGSINGINGATANTDIGITTTAPNARLNIGGVAGNQGGFGIGDGQAISITDGRRRSIQIATDNNYGGINDNHTGYLIYSIMPGTWGSGELHICAANNWGTYATGTPALRVTQTTTYANGTALTSDKRLKKDVQENPYGIETIMQLTALKYKKLIVDSFANGEMVFNKSIQIDEVGFFAQDVYNIIPEVVLKPKDESKETWAIDYSKIVPILTQAIQDQQEMIKELENNQQQSIEELKQENENLRKQNEEILQRLMEIESKM